MGPIELVLGLVEALPFLGFDIPGILPCESYIDLHALVEYTWRSYPSKASLPHEIYPVSALVFFLLSLPPLPMENPSFHSLSTSRGEFNEPLSSSTSGYEPCPDLIAMVSKWSSSLESTRAPDEST